MFADYSIHIYIYISRFSFWTFFIFLRFGGLQITVNHKRLATVLEDLQAQED